MKALGRSGSMITVQEAQFVNYDSDNTDHYSPDSDKDNNQDDHWSQDSVSDLDTAKQQSDHLTPVSDRERNTHQSGHSTPVSDRDKHQSDHSTPDSEWEKEKQQSDRSTPVIDGNQDTDKQESDHLTPVSYLNRDKQLSDHLTPVSDCHTDRDGGKQQNDHSSPIGGGDKQTGKTDHWSPVVTHLVHSHQSNHLANELIELNPVLVKVETNNSANNNGRGNHRKKHRRTAKKKLSPYLKSVALIETSVNSEAGKKYTVKGQHSPAVILQGCDEQYYKNHTSVHYFTVPGNQSKGSVTFRAQDEQCMVSLPTDDQCMVSLPTDDQCMVNDDPCMVSQPSDDEDVVQEIALFDSLDDLEEAPATGRRIPPVYVEKLNLPASSDSERNGNYTCTIPYIETN